MQLRTKQEMNYYTDFSLVPFDSLMFVAGILVHVYRARSKLLPVVASHRSLSVAVPKGDNPRFSIEQNFIGVSFNVFHASSRSSLNCPSERKNARHIILVFLLGGR